MQITVTAPTDRQREFLTAKERFVGYGGARGGGKSIGIQIKIKLLGLRYPGIRMLLIRRTFPELRENHIIPLQSELMGITKYKDSDKSFTFINGSRLVCGYCANDADVLQFQGQQYDVIFIDEATQLSEFQYQALTACMRGANKFPRRMYLTCNPGGMGHAWFKRLFIDRDFRNEEDANDYKFIQAKVYDNPHLMESDPEYVRMLKNLPDKQRAAWLDGSWDVFDGQYFTAWNRDIHVIRPFVIPDNWRRYVAMDYGRDMFACYFIAVDEHSRAYVYKEIYEPDLLASAAAEKLNEYTTESIYAYYAPPDLFNKQSHTGRSTADIFLDAGIALQRANNDRVQGWYDLAEWLQPYDDEQGIKIAQLRVFDNCVNLIRTLPLLQYDAKNPNDAANEPHEITHAPDAIRYFIAGQPTPARMKKQPKIYNFEAERPRKTASPVGSKIHVI